MVSWAALVRSTRNSCGGLRMVIEAKDVLLFGPGKENVSYAGHLS